MDEVNQVQLRKIQQEINNFKSQISESAKQKEFWFRKKESLKKDINDLIKKIKEVKSSTDKSNIDVQEFKKLRDSSNKLLQGQREKIKKLADDKSRELKKLNIRIEPSKIKARINALDKQVETETNFNKEKKAMEEIKRLKKMASEFSVVTKIDEEIKKCRDEMNTLNKKARDSNDKIQDLVHGSDYAEFMDISKKITELKKTQEDAFNKFIEFKNKYLELNKQYKAKLEEAKPFRELLEKEHENTKQRQADKQTKLLREKTAEVEEKIKKKKKLTTADILAFQGLKEE